MAIRKATIDDLIIQELNNGLFELEKENYDSTSTRNWPYLKCLYFLREM